MNHVWTATALIALIALVTTVAPIPAASAQQPAVGDGGPGTGGLPTEVAAELEDRLNDLATEIRSGDTRFPAGAPHTGDVAVLEGDATVAGVIDGTLVVVNGTVEFAPGAEVTGDVIVVGGETRNSGAARVAGEIRTYADRFRYERADGEFRHLHGEPVPPALADSPRRGADFLLTTGKSYNRVEGLPIAFGPRIETAGSNPLRLQAIAVYRTESGLDLDVDRMGYFVRADQFLGGRREYRLGATLHSVVDPIEEWQVSDLETGLATFLFRRDYRDHFERTGWSAFGIWEPLAMPLSVSLEALWEKHELAPARSPWSIIRNSDPWRPQPVVAEGRLGSVAARLTYDTRGTSWNPASGWLVRGRLEHGFHVDLDYPVLAPRGEGAPSPPVPASPGRFLAGLIDLRSYNRVDADARLNLRIVAGGSLTGDPLPPQRQHALGGAGSLPGYSLFSTDCGARSASFSLAGQAGSPGAAPFFADYGCDAFGLLQVEYRGKLSFRMRWDGGPWSDTPRGGEEDVRELGWAMSPDWAIFVDAGRGWAFHPGRPDVETRVDVGAGLLLERIGLYLAVPVTGRSRVNLFLRLGPRF